MAIVLSLPSSPPPRRFRFDLNRDRAYAPSYQPLPHPKHGTGSSAPTSPETADTERMERFCDDLRQQREQRQVSLQTISDVTKVATRHLQALEEGHFAELPGGVFRKGILRSYLAALDTDPAPWLQRFDALLLETGTTVPLPAAAFDQFLENVRRSRPPSHAGSRHRWGGVLLMVAVLVTLCCVVWIFAVRGHLSL